METQPLLDVRGVRKVFPKPGGGELLVLDDIDLRVQEGEILVAPTTSPSWAPAFAKIGA